MASIKVSEGYNINLSDGLDDISDFEIQLAFAPL